MVGQREAMRQRENRRQELQMDPGQQAMMRKAIVNKDYVNGFGGNLEDTLAQVEKPKDMKVRIERVAKTLSPDDITPDQVTLALFLHRPEYNAGHYKLAPGKIAVHQLMGESNWHPSDVGILNEMTVQTHQELQRKQNELQSPETQNNESHIRMVRMNIKKLQSWHTVLQKYTQRVAKVTGAAVVGNMEQKQSADAKVAEGKRITEEHAAMTQTLDQIRAMVNRRGAFSPTARNIRKLLVEKSGEKQADKPKR